MTTDAQHFPASPSTAPPSTLSLHVIVPFEGRPIVYADALSEGEALRLQDWLRASPEARELLELAERWGKAA